MRTYTLLVAALTASANAAAYIDIKQSGEIVGVSWAVDTASSPTAGDRLTLELGMQSSMQSVNDAIGIIDQLSIGVGASATGVAVPNVNKWSGPMSYPVRANDRIYINATEAGSSSWSIRVTLHVR